MQHGLLTTTSSALTLEKNLLERVCGSLGGFVINQIIAPESDSKMMMIVMTV